MTKQRSQADLSSSVSQCSRYAGYHGLLVSTCSNEAVRDDALRLVPSMSCKQDPEDPSEAKCARVDPRVVEDSDALVG